MAHVKSVLVVLLAVLAMALSAVPAAAGPGRGTQDGNSQGPSIHRQTNVTRHANVTWE